MALDFIYEADSQFLTDNFLSAEDWEDDLCQYNGFQNGLSEADELIKDLPNLESAMESNDIQLDSNQLSNTCFTDDLVDPWMKLNNDDPTSNISSIVGGGVHIKSEPLSPPPSSSSSDASGDSMPPSQIQFFTDPSTSHLKLESPPLTPPRDSNDVPSPLSPSVVPFNPQIVAIHSGPQTKTKTHRTSRPPIAPKIEPRSQSTSIAVKQLAVGQPLLLTQAEVDRLKAQGLITETKPYQQQSVQQCQPSAITSMPSAISPAIPVSSPVPSPVTLTPEEPPPNVDVKQWKRQQRMIKNRESACLSRKKKKEYLQGLEDHIRDLNSENEKLRHENSLLRRKLETLQNENTSLRKVQSLLPSSNKTTACLLTVLLFVGLNFAPISIISSADEDPYAAQHGGRALLGYSEDTAEAHIRHATELSVHDNSEGLGANSLIPSSEATNQTSTLEQARELMIRGFADYMLSKGPPSCPKLNSTETHRLADVLLGWAQQHHNEQRKQTEENQQKDDQKQIRERRKKRAAKKRRFNNPLRKEAEPQATLHVQSDEKSLQLYDSLFQKNYANLLDALHRRDDTFYVVSFRKDHLLLPATAHNNTQRPRMSLVMPAVITNETSLNAPPDHFSMMQIDCEVMNTKVVHVKDGPYQTIKNETIPPHIPLQHRTRPVFVNTDEENQRHPKNVTIT
ncbi:cyclic AMP-dependent transcription factor ATF-6 beta-like [Amphiura filiformis]|uniref:cyclic AMP-dependent transcription factor ATF-6 beta-like n=1 Tax=Amphiura filiformis TaxID=82378 RepID=UPI003B218C2B